MYNDKLEQQKNLILRKFKDRFYKISEDWDCYLFENADDRNQYFKIFKSNCEAQLYIHTWLDVEELKLIAKLYEVMQYLGEV